MDAVLLAFINGGYVGRLHCCWDLGKGVLWIGAVIQAYREENQVGRCMTSGIQGKRFRWVRPLDPLQVLRER